ncbi:hypothetical protein RGQ29_012890 [Quercus rubra]|uniref:Uncharacterized protein n=1 Tax=Quercus rubra TaxID=3512 RepID=A0AAN7G0X6_QUERU|nr:hypothetical protein RGQ29_012890 [Quercus rubra]
MRPYLAVSLLLLSLLLSVVQGIRLDKSFMSSVGQHKEEKSALTKIHDSAVQEVILCKDGHCTGKNRKLITTTTISTTSTTTSTTTTTSKNEKNGENKADTNSKGKSGSGELGEKENSMVKGRPTSEVSQSHDHHEQFPDIIDLAEMDYSPAKRKPPIHN